MMSFDTLSGAKLGIARNVSNAMANVHPRSHLQLSSACDGDLSRLQNAIRITPLKCVMYRYTLLQHIGEPDFTLGYRHVRAFPKNDFSPSSKIRPIAFPPIRYIDRRIASNSLAKSTIHLIFSILDRAINSFHSYLGRFVNEMSLLSFYYIL